MMNQNFHVLNKQVFSKKIDFFFFLLFIFFKKIILTTPSLASAFSEITS